MSCPLPIPLLMKLNFTAHDSYRSKAVPITAYKSSQRLQAKHLIFNAHNSSDSYIFKHITCQRNHFWILP